MNCQCLVNIHLIEGLRCNLPRPLYVSFCIIPWLSTTLTLASTVTLTSTVIVTMMTATVIVTMMTSWTVRTLTARGVVFIYAAFWTRRTITWQILGIYTCLGGREVVWLVTPFWARRPCGTRWSWTVRTPITRILVPIYAAIWTWFSPAMWSSTPTTLASPG